MWGFGTLGAVKVLIKLSGYKEAEEIHLMEFLLPLSSFYGYNIFSAALICTGNDKLSDTAVSCLIIHLFRMELHTIDMFRIVGDRLDGSVSCTHIYLETRCQITDGLMMVAENADRTGTNSGEPSACNNTGRMPYAHMTADILVQCSA